MTTSTYTPDQLTASGATDTYTYTFEIPTQNDIDVYLAGVLQTITTHYTVTGAGNDAGGTVVFVSTPALNTAITFKRSVSGVRSSDFQQSGDFKAETINDELDRLTMRDQEMDEVFGRAIKFSATSTTSDVDIASLTSEAVLQVNTAGDAIIMGPDISTINSALAITDSYVGSVVQNPLIGPDVLSGDGSSVAFTISTDVGDYESAVLVTVDGVVKRNAEYTISGTTLTFTSAPANSTNIEVIYIGALAVDAAAAATSATNAATSETNAAASATLASDWAIKAEDVIVSGSDYSSLHHAAKSAASATAAAASATAALTLDADGDTGIEVERTTDLDEIYLKANGTDIVHITSSGMTLTGDLTVTGSSAQVNVTNFTVDDLLTVIASGQSSGSWDSGFIVDRGSSTNVGFIYDESALEFALINTTEDGTTVGDVAISSYADLRVDVLTGTATEAQYADLAERYFADDEYEIGTVLMAGGRNEVSDAGNAFIGVVSDKPAHLMNADAGPDKTHPKLALQGRVQIKVRGKVKKGDYLVAFGDGTAKKATKIDRMFKPLSIIAISVADKNTKEIGLVEGRLK